MQKVLFLFGESVGNIYETFGRGMASVAAEIDIELVPLRVSRDPSFFSTLDNAADEGVEFAFGFAGAGHALTVDPSDPGSQSLWEYLQVPHISLYGDSPAYAFDFHRQYGNFSVSLYGFAEHLRLRRNLPDVRGVLGNLVAFGLNPGVRAGIDFASKQKGKILFLKNGNSAKSLYRFWDGSFNASTAKHLFALKEIAQAEQLRANSTPVQDIVEEYLSNIGLEHTHLLKLKLLLISQMDDLIRRIKSELVADALLDYPVEIWGVNWGHLNLSRRVGKVVERCDVGASNLAMRQEALCIVDMSPNTDSNYHDRQIRAADAYTLCISNQQRFLDENSKHSKEFTYAFSKESISNRIESVLSNPKATIELGIRVSEEFHQRFRARDEIVRWGEIANLIRTNSMTEPPENCPPFLVWPPTTL